MFKLTSEAIYTIRFTYPNGDIKECKNASTFLMRYSSQGLHRKHPVTKSRPVKIQIYPKLPEGGAEYYEDHFSFTYHPMCKGVFENLSEAPKEKPTMIEIGHQSMEMFIGTKLVKSLAMDRAEYNTYRGWDLPADEDGSDEGYLVEYLDGGKSNHPYHDGYISWSPKEQFDNAYRKTDGLSFGLAVEAAKKGMKVARVSWNKGGQFAYIVPAAMYHAQTEVARDHFGDSRGEPNVPYRAYWALKTAQNDIATWAPSASDSLADDWMIV